MKSICVPTQLATLHQCNIRRRNGGTVIHNHLFLHLPNYTLYAVAADRRCAPRAKTNEHVNYSLPTIGGTYVCLSACGKQQLTALMRVCTLKSRSLIQTNRQQHSYIERRSPVRMVYII